MKTKICSKCGKEKDLSEFYKVNRYKNKLRSECKKCQKEHQKRQRDKNKTKL